MGDQTTRNEMITNDKHLQALYKHAGISGNTVEQMRSLTPEQLDWKQNDRSWSVGECLDHITNTTNAYLLNVEKALKTARDKDMTYNKPMKAGLFARWFIKTVGPNSSMKLSAPGIFRPEAVERNESSVDAFLKMNEALMQTMIKADQWNVNKPKLSSPLTGLIRFSIGEALWLQVAHAQRHLLQARRVTEHAEFPK